jgi:hypothetical protein
VDDATRAVSLETSPEELLALARRRPRRVLDNPALLRICEESPELYRRIINAAANGLLVPELLAEIEELWQRATESERRRLALDCAARVLPIFEARRPGETRPRAALSAWEDHLAGRASFLRVRLAALAAYGVLLGETGRGIAGFFSSGVGPEEALVKSVAAAVAAATGGPQRLWEACEAAASVEALAAMKPRAGALGDWFDGEARGEENLRDTQDSSYAEARGAVHLWQRGRLAAILERGSPPFR